MEIRTAPTPHVYASSQVRYPGFGFHPKIESHPADECAMEDFKNLDCTKIYQNFKQTIHV